MSKAKSNPTTRTFVVDKRNGDRITVTTPLSDAEALDVLGGETVARNGTDFKAKCAFEIYKAVHGFRASEALFKWGHVLAYEAKHGKAKSNGEKCRIPALTLDMVRERKPLRIDLPDGGVVRIGKCGPGAKNPGSYVLNNDVAFRQPGSKFYGYATPEGEWTLTRDVTDAVRKAVLGE